MNQPKRYTLRTIDAAVVTLTEVVREFPGHCNPSMHSAPESCIFGQLLIRCNLPVPEWPITEPFVQYWDELPVEHRLRLAIPRDVAAWLTRVNAVFDGPNDFDKPGAGRVQWNEGLRRCRSRLLL